MKFYYQILNLFNKCDHKEEVFVSSELREVPYKTVLASKDTYECKKCGRKRTEHNYQRLEN